MTNKQLDELKAQVGNLEETAEGQLRGGFAVVGGGISPHMDYNDNCNNEACNVSCGDVKNVGKCSNFKCNGFCTTKASSGSSSIAGMGFAL